VPAARLILLEAALLIIIIYNCC